jgi:two-component system sensor histidine kinase DesK
MISACTEGLPVTPRRRGLLPAGHHLGWTPYAWLVFLANFLIEPIVRWHQGTLSAAFAALTLLSVVAFLASYFRGYWVHRRELILIVAFQTFLGAAFAPANLGSTVFFIYAACHAGGIERSRIAALAILLVVATGLLTTWATAAPLHFLIPAAGLPLLLGFVNLHFAQAKRAHTRLRLAQEEIERLAAVAERERIARDLHDVLGHTLSLIVLKSELAAKLATRDPDRATREIRDVEQVARKALREVRETIRGYRASLADGVEQSRAILGAAGIRAEVAVEPAPLGREVEEVVALALREAVTNVVRHSGARVCRVRVRAHADTCILEVEDDGRGGDPLEGSGLRGMRERVEAIGGSVRRGPGTAGSGLQIQAMVPVTR